MNKTIFAGGCFWCVEHDLRTALGVSEVISGYTRSPEEIRNSSHPLGLSATPPQAGGEESKVPTYYDHHGFHEAVEVTYDAEKTIFKKLCQFFLDHIDPTDAGGQFADRGEAYQTVIFYKTDEEKNIANTLLVELDASGLYHLPHVVKVLPEGEFYKAEEEHQDYAEKNPIHYQIYRQGSGREEFVNRTCAIREEKSMVWRD